MSLKKEIKYPIPIERKNLSPIIEPKKSKYRNKKIIIDEITFDSTKEGKRYLELKQKEKQGEISNLRLQVKFELQPSFKINGKTIKSINYICDFQYFDNNKNCYVIEDVKASKKFQTDVYKLKKKLFEYKYKIEIKEIY